MQIRLTVVDPLGTRSEGRAASGDVRRDVLVTAPAGTALAAVASALVSAVAGGDGPAAVLYAGVERLDAQRATLGEPPLTDGAVLHLGAPAEPGPDEDGAAVQLHVVAGPDAGGVHLLHGGEIRVGRSADADVPLDDPDVSRLHCAVTLSDDGRVTVADLGSTNGTSLNGRAVDGRAVRFPPGSLLRIGESALRLAAADETEPLATAPDGEGCVRVLRAADSLPHGMSPARPGPAAPAEDSRGLRGSRAVDVQGRAERGEEGPHAREEAGGPSVGAPGEDPSEARGVPYAQGADAVGEGAATARRAPVHPPEETHHGFGTAGWGAAGGASEVRGHGPGTPRAAPERGGAPEPATGHGAPPRSARKGTAPGGTAVPRELRKRGFTAWARRLAGGGRGAADDNHAPYDAYDAYDEGAPALHEPVAAADPAPERWPDPAALLLTALGPGPRLWERGPGDPEALVVRLGTADRPVPDGSGLLPAVPVTAGLREVGALGIAGPRVRLPGLARAVLAQLAALHSPDTLEIVLLSTDRSRTLAERTAEWSWLGWLPHLRPAHGQDCRLLLAYDREQATARTEELLRRLDDITPRTTASARASLAAGGPHGSDGGGPAGTATSPDRTDGHGPTAPPSDTHPSTSHPSATHASASHSSVPRRSGAVADDAASTHIGVLRPPAADPAAGGAGSGRGGAAHQPSWARDDTAEQGAHGGPFVVVVVDGDPGAADLREAVARLTTEGPRAGIHVVCLAETPAASPASPVAETYEAACAAVPAFRACGAVALLSGDVATALRLVRVAQGGPAGHGTVAAVDAVSAAWAERFARALAPLRTDGTGDQLARVSTPLPQSARLLDELGLARATPASLMARWADAADDTDALGGRAWAVLGAGPRGPVCADLVTEGPHLLIEGPAGSGRTELLRSVAASLASAERPDRLGMVLMDGRDGATAGGSASRGDGLRVCTDLPHVTTHLGANDPVRMREFAQSLSAELKRRAELLGRLDFTEWHAQRQVSGRLVGQRSGGDLDTPSSSTLRLRPPGARDRTEPGPPLARLVVLVDDLDALLSPALGSPGRPAAGSVVRALEAVARDGERLGVHLVAATGEGGRTAETELARRAPLRVVLDAVATGPEEPAAGRGRLAHGDGRVTPFQGGRVTGRIPRTATLRPTVVPLEWERMGDPPARRSVRELGNGPTDLALLASALERAARSVSATEVPSLL
ncbi:FHA domain-containing protein [Streptomyces cavernae]|uniref:FHA domain-containing protein n=1 Tax=Streptomyces cavernae TaxID=2259034 RepID=UPI000FEB9FC8|nr:FHA domain-containing protein [Streptomyces cavernae]